MDRIKILFMAELPLAPFERIAKKAGAKRISAEAVEELRNTIEDMALELAKHAVDFAHHARRKTVKESDIKLIQEK
jgi:DNA-binding protein